MSALTRKTLLLVIVLILGSAETFYFARQVSAGYWAVLGRRAFIKTDFARAWEAYEVALRRGGDRASIESQLLDLLVFALLQSESGIDLEMPVSPEESFSLARDLVKRRLRDTPYDAHVWSKDAEIKLYASRRDRRATPLDVSRLSENPLENLLPEEKAAIESFRIACSLEPNNYFYHDLLASFLLAAGATSEAVEQIRLGVSSYPRNDGHSYLNERRPPDEVIAAAIDGFKDAAGKPSLVRRAHINIDAGQLLMLQGDYQEAVSLLEQAVAEAPGLFESHYNIGQAFFRMGDYQRAIEHFEKATEISPSIASADYYLGRSYEAIGNRPAAIEAMTLARQRNPDELKYRYHLGKLLESDGRLREAERQFVAATNMRPDDPVTWLELTRFHDRAGDRPSALQACARLLSLEQDNRDYQALCSTLEQESR